MSICCSSVALIAVLVIIYQYSCILETKEKPGIGARLPYDNTPEGVYPRDLVDYKE